MYQTKCWAAAARRKPVPKNNRSRPSSAAAGRKQPRWGSRLSARTGAATSKVDASYEFAPLNLSLTGNARRDAEKQWLISRMAALSRLQVRLLCCGVG